MSERITDNELSLLESRAADYALGILTEEEKAAIEKELPFNPELKAAVAQWESILHSTMEKSITPTQPDKKVLRNIESKLDFDNRPEWIKWISGNMPMAFASLIVVVCSSLLAFSQLTPFNPSNDLVAHSMKQAMEVDIMGPDNNVAWTVQASFDARQVMIKTHNEIPTMPGRNCRIWMLDKSGSPVLVGILPHQGERLMTIPVTADKAMSMERDLILTIDEYGNQSDMEIDEDNIVQRIPWHNARRVEF